MEGGVLGREVGGKAKKWELCPGLGKLLGLSVPQSPHLKNGIVMIPVP